MFSQLCRSGRSTFHLGSQFNFITSRTPLSTSQPLALLLFLFSFSHFHFTFTFTFVCWPVLSRSFLLLLLRLLSLARFYPQLTSFSGQQQQQQWRASERAVERESDTVTSNFEIVFCRHHQWAPASWTFVFCGYFWLPHVHYKDWWE